MAGTRKSEYSGDCYGDFVVTGRAPAENGKRRWFVRNEVTGEEKIVLQTALVDLASSQPADWSAGLPVDHEPGTYPGVTMETLDEIVFKTYEPQGPDSEAARIVAKVLAAKALDLNPDEMFDDWTTGLELLDDVLFYNTDPDLMDYISVELAQHEYDHGIDPVDWTIEDRATGTVRVDLTTPFKLVQVSPHDLPDTPGIETLILEAEVVEENVVTKFDGIGESAEDGVSEIDLDNRVPIPDPMRAAIRKILGEIHSAREEFNEQVTMLTIRLEGLMDLADEALKIAITTR